MRRRALTFLTALVLSLLVAAPASAADSPWYQDGPGGRVLINDGWLFRADPGNRGLAQHWAARASVTGWTATSVPNAWNAGDDSNASMAGSVGWYRRDFQAPASPARARWVVRFESVNYFATVFLNGKKVGQHEGAAIPFEVALKRLHRGVNHLVIRVDSRRGRTSMPPGPSGGWWNYGGILREVYLRPIYQLDIAQLLTRTLPGKTLLIRATLANPGAASRTGSVNVRVAGRRLRLGRVTVPAGRSRSVAARVRIPNALVWEPREPHLYEVDATATVAGRKVATYTVHTGLRRVTMGYGGHLKLNGAALNLRGAAVHEQTPTRGSALTPPDYDAEIGLLRGLNADFTRSHYPLSERFLEAADREGIAVWEEIPFYQLSESAMRRPRVRKKALNYLAATIRRDQNHPSVIAWSIGNELPATPGRGQAAYIRAAVKLVHQLDPTRPVALAIAGYPTKNYFRAYAPLDILGINDYFGWYHGPLGQIENRDALGQYLDRMHAFYPNKALFVTEFGAEANRDGPPEEKGTYGYQADFMNFQLSTFATRPWINGAVVWTLQDFKVHPNWKGGNPFPDSPWLRKGLADQYGNLKPAWGPTASAFAATPALVRSGG